MEEEVKKYIPNYLVWSILATLFCCLPFGIVAIVFSAKVDGLAAAGMIDQAEEASANAKKWCWIAAISGVAIMVLWILFVGTAALIPAVVESGNMN